MNVKIRSADKKITDTVRLNWLQDKGTIEIQCSLPGDRYAIGDQCGEEDFETLREAIDASIRDQR